MYYKNNNYTINILISIIIDKNKIIIILVGSKSYTEVIHLEVTNIL